MSILVTGASGFLGYPLVQRLLDDGYHVVALSRTNMPNCFDSHSNLEWVKSDIMHEDINFSDFSKVEAVFHLAGMKELSDKEDECLFLEANEKLTIRLINFCSRFSKKFIFASSQMVYGDPGHLSVTEEFPLSGFNSSAYACSKLNAENWMRYLQKKYGGLYISLRFCGFIDGGGNIDYMINQALHNEPIELYSKGEICRDYLTVEKSTDAFMAALRYESESCFDAFNIGFGHPVSTHDMAKLICDELKSSSAIILSKHPAPRLDFVFSIDKAEKQLGYVSGDLRESIRSYAQQKKQHLCVR